MRGRVFTKGLAVSAALVAAAIASQPAAAAGEVKPAREQQAVEISTVIRLSPVNETWMSWESPYPWLGQDLLGSLPEQPAASVAAPERSSSGLGDLVRRWLDSLVESSLLNDGFWPLADGQLRAFLGRAAIAWGPGQFGQLTPGSSTPLDWFLLDYSRPSLHYRQGVAALDWSSDRYLLAHRLEWDWGDSPVRVGISETMTVMPGFRFHPGYVVPFTPYSFWSWLDRLTNPDQELYVHDNFGFDVQMRLPDGQFYGQVFFADRPAVFPDGRSWEGLAQAAGGLFPPSAWLVGWSWELRTAESQLTGVRPQLQVEYTHASPLAYRGVSGINAYSLGSRLPGFSLGPDSDMLVVHVGWTEIRPLPLPSWALPGYRSEGLGNPETGSEVGTGQGLAAGLGQPAAWELAVGREAVESAVARLAMGDGKGVEKVPITAVAKTATPASGEGGQTVTVPATVSTYGEVRFTRRGGSDSQTGTAASEKSVRIAVGQSLSWNEVKVDIQLGIEQTVKSSRPGQPNAGLVAEVKITIPLDF